MCISPVHVSIILVIRSSCFGLLSKVRFSHAFGSVTFSITCSISVWSFDQIVRWWWWHENVLSFPSFSSSTSSFFFYKMNHSKLNEQKGVPRMVWCSLEAVKGNYCCSCCFFAFISLQFNLLNRTWLQPHVYLLHITNTLAQSIGRDLFLRPIVLPMGVPLNSFFLSQSI